MASHVSALPRFQFFRFLPRALSSIDSSGLYKFPKSSSSLPAVSSKLLIGIGVDNRNIQSSVGVVALLVSLAPPPVIPVFDRRADKSKVSLSVILLFNFKLRLSLLKDDCCMIALSFMCV